MMLLFLFALLPRIEIVAANDSSVTYRELTPLRVALDPTTRLFHYAGCPEIGSGMESVSPAAATLRGYKAHKCVGLRKDEYELHTETRAPHDRALISVLFLGNSLTYFNEMPRMTARIGARENPPLFVDAVTMSGADLEGLWFRTDALRRIWQSHWDYVIIQERGGSGAHDQGDLFHKYLGRFAYEARKSGATPLLFMTWYERYPAEQEKFMRAAARRANVGVLPVAVAWKDDFNWDGVHPNVAGSYLIACTVYSLIYNKPALGTPFDFRDLAVKNEFYDKPLLEQSLNEEQAKAIQQAAWNAVKNP
jgi:hypothetical protein